LDFSKVLNELWKIEKIASIEAIKIAKNEDLKFLAYKREKIMRMSHEEALKELIKLSKIESKIKIIENINDNGLFEIK
jgi:type II restriction enzyme